MIKFNKLLFFKIVAICASICMLVDISGYAVSNIRVPLMSGTIKNDHKEKVIKEAQPSIDFSYIVENEIDIAVRNLRSLDGKKIKRAVKKLLELSRVRKTLPLKKGINRIWDELLGAYLKKGYATLGIHAPTASRKTTLAEYLWSSTGIIQRGGVLVLTTDSYLIPISERKGNFHWDKYELDQMFADIRTLQHGGVIYVPSWSHQVVSLENKAKGRGRLRLEKKQINHDSLIEENEHILSTTYEGENIYIRKNQWQDNDRSHVDVLKKINAAGKIIIIEGAINFLDPETNSGYDVKVFFDIDWDTRFILGVNRWRGGGARGETEEAFIRLLEERRKTEDYPHGIPLKAVADFCLDASIEIKTIVASLIDENTLIRTAATRAINKKKGTNVQIAVSEDIVTLTFRKNSEIVIRENYSLSGSLISRQYLTNSTLGNLSPGSWIAIEVYNPDEKLSRIKYNGGVNFENDMSNIRSINFEKSKEGYRHVVVLSNGDEWAIFRDKYLHVKKKWLSDEDYSSIMTVNEFLIKNPNSHMPLVLGADGTVGSSILEKITEKSQVVSLIGKIDDYTARQIKDLTHSSNAKLVHIEDIMTLHGLLQLDGLISRAPVVYNFFGHHQVAFNNMDELLSSFFADIVCTAVTVELCRKYGVPLVNPSSEHIYQYVAPLDESGKKKIVDDTTLIVMPGNREEIREFIHKLSSETLKFAQVITSGEITNMQEVNEFMTEFLQQNGFRTLEELQSALIDWYMVKTVAREEMVNTLPAGLGFNLRLSKVFGKRNRRTHYTAGQAVVDILRGRKDYGAPDECCFTYTGDLGCVAMRIGEMASHRELTKNYTFNVNSLRGQSITALEFHQMVASCYDSSIQLSEQLFFKGQAPIKRPIYTTKLIEDILGFQPTPLNEAVNVLVDYWKKDLERFNEITGAVTVKLHLDGLWSVIQHSPQPSYPAETVFGIAKRKRLALEWNYQNGRISEAIYRLVARYLDNLITGGVDNIINLMPITRVEENVGLHVNNVFHHTLLHMILGGEDEKTLNKTVRNNLHNSIDEYLSTPKVKIVQFIDGTKETFSPHVVHKPWGMELWIAENEVFGVKCIYTMQGECESVQVHERKMESKLYFGPVNVLHLNRLEFEQLKKESLGKNPTQKEIKSFVESLPFVSVGSDNCTVQTVHSDIVHTSLPQEGLMMHLEFNAGEKADSPTVTTRLLDKYSNEERTHADQLGINWWGPRLPVALGRDVVVFNVISNGRGTTETVLPEADGVVCVKKTPDYVVDRLCFSINQSRTIVGNTRTAETLILLQGELDIEKEGWHYSLKVGEVYELSVGETITLTSKGESQLLHVYAMPFSPVSALVQKAKEKNEGILFIGAQSPLIIDAAILAAREKNYPLIFIPSRNQVDVDEFGSGYVLKWNQKGFVDYVQARLKALQYNGDVIYYRDHSGPWQRNEEFNEAISAEEAMTRAKASLLADLKAGFTALHIDATRSPIPSEWDLEEPHRAKDKLVIERTVELIEYVENQRQVLGLPIITYEVGGERESWDESSIETLDIFLTKLRKALREHRFEKLPITLITINPSPLMGRGPRQDILHESIIQRLVQVIETHGFQVKYHNGDFMSHDDRERLTQLGVYTLNVGLELSMIQTRALLALADKEEIYLLHEGTNKEIAPSNFRTVLTEAVLNGNRWKKWVTENYSIADIMNNKAKLKEIVEFNGHYVYEEPTVKEAMQQLATNIRKLEGENSWLTVREDLRTAITDLYESLESADIFSNIPFRRHTNINVSL